MERGESCCCRLRQGNTKDDVDSHVSGGGPSFRQRGRGHIRALTTAAITVMKGQTQQRRTPATAGTWSVDWLATMEETAMEETAMAAAAGGGERPPFSSVPMGITDIHVHIHPTPL